MRAKFVFLFGSGWLGWKAARETEPPFCVQLGQPGYESRCCVERSILLAPMAPWHSIHL